MNNPVGVPSTSIRPAFFDFTDLGLGSSFEEIDIAALLWDSYDNTPQEILTKPGFLTKDRVHLDISTVLKLTTAEPRTISDFYVATQAPLSQLLLRQRSASSLHTPIFV